jgi:hypothetical protein
MLAQWKETLESNESLIIEAYSEVMFPRLAGFILYHVHHSDSYLEVDDISLQEYFPVGDESMSLRSISAHRHGHMRVYYYQGCQVDLADMVSTWWELYQFESHTGRGDWNLPCTWQDIVEEWVQSKRDFEVLGSILEGCVEPGIVEAFAQEWKSDPWPDSKNLWEYVYLTECDDSQLTYLVWHLEDHLLAKAASCVLWELEERYAWFYRSHKAMMLKKMRDEAERLRQFEEQQKINRQLAMKVLPEFHKRLSRNYGLIVPQLRFAKDLEIWPQLRQTLETFSPPERCAIIFVSQCSNSVRAEFAKLP